MYLQFYGLTEKPFSLTPDPKYFFASGSHAEARDLIRYGVREREGFLSVTGAIGTGKTTVLRTVLEGFGRDVVTALVLNPFLSEEDLLRIILVDFGIATREELNADGRRYTKQDLVDRLNDHLLALSSQGRAAVLVIDEAQNLPLPVMEQIRLLSNLETAKEKLLQIVLAGQLGLRDLLTSPKLRQLNQRISIRYRIQPLSTEEIGRYIDHRLRIAGSQGDIVFTDPAIERIYRYSQGVPRLVNLMADRALLAGYAAKTRTVAPEMIDRAADTLDLGPASGGGPPVEPDADKERKGTSWIRRVLLGTASSVALLAGGYAAMTGFGEVPILADDAARGGVASSESRATSQPVSETDAGSSPTPGDASSSASENGEEPGSVGRDVRDPGRAAEASPDARGASTKSDREDPARSVESLPAGDWTVYLSSFKDPDDPELSNLRWRLSEAGFQNFLVEVSVPGQGTLYRLVAGGYADSGAARSAAGDLQEELDVEHARVVAVNEVLGS